MNDVSKKRNRFAAIIIAACFFLIFVFSFAALNISATTFNLYDGVQVFSIDDGVIEDFEPQSVLYHFDDTLAADYLYNPYIYIIAKYYHEDEISDYWLIEDDFGRTYNIDIDTSNDFIDGTGDFQVIKGQYIGTINNALDQFTLINAQNNNYGAISPYQFAYLIVVDPALVDILEFERSFVYGMVVDVLNSSNNGIYNTDILFNAIENTQDDWYSKGYYRGVIDGKAQGKELWYDIAYDKGYDYGYAKGQMDEYNRILTSEKYEWTREAYERGKNQGYQDGVNDAENFSPQKVPFAIMDAIYKFFHGMLNFDLFGINLLGLFGAIITISIGVFVFKKLL